MARLSVPVSVSIPSPSMDLSVKLYLGLLVVVALLRFYELHISKRHQQLMVSEGASRVSEPRFRWMVVVHTFVLVGAAVEVVFLHRPFYPIFGGLFRHLPCRQCRPLVGDHDARESLECSGHEFHFSRVRLRLALSATFVTRTTLQCC